MKRARFLSALLVFAISVFGCGGEGGSDDPSDSCEDAVETFEDCGTDLEDELEFTCDEIDDLEGEVSDDCEDATADLFNCLADLTCDEIDEIDEIICEDEFVDFLEECEDA